MASTSRWLSSQYEPKPDARQAPYLAEITMNIDARAVLFSGNAARRVADRVNMPDNEGRKYLYEMVMAGNLAAFFAFMSEFFAAAGYFGSVDCGLLVTGLTDGYSVGRVEGREFVIWGDTPHFNADRFSQVRQLAAASELADAEGVALNLLGRLFETTTGRDDYSPFETASP